MTDNRRENNDLQSGHEPAPAAAPPSAIRSAFLARTDAASATAAGVAAVSEIDTGGVAVRSAYLAQLGRARTDAAGEASASSGNILRRAYAARLARSSVPTAVGARAPAKRAQGAKTKKAPPKVKAAKRAVAKSRTKPKPAAKRGRAKPARSKRRR